MLTFSPVLSLSPDVSQELACELVFISADTVKCICVCQKANKSNKEKALDWELSVVRQEILLEGMELLGAFRQYFNTSISPPLGKDYPDVVLIQQMLSSQKKETNNWGKYYHLFMLTFTK